MLGMPATSVRGFSDGLSSRNTPAAVNADFEAGYAHEPEHVAANVRLCVATGIAGLSIEDATGDKQRPLYDLDLLPVNAGRNGFQVDDDEAAEPQVVEKQVDVEVVAIDLQVHLAPDKGEAHPELQQEALDVIAVRGAPCSLCPPAISYSNVAPQPRPPGNLRRQQRSK